MSTTDEFPLVSFLTPAYKTEAYLAQTIETVIGQTRGDWELVVVDNGNSPAIAAIAEAYTADPRVRLICQENKGYVGGVMAAAAVARARFVCVLDSDDLLMPEFVETVSAFLSTHPGVHAVGCDAHLFVDGEDKPFGRGYINSTGTRRPAKGGDRLSVADVLAGRVPYYTAAIRRDAWDAVGGYDPGIAGVDESVLIWLRLAAQFDVRVVPDRLARYRVRQESLSRDPAKVEQFEEHLIQTFEAFAQQSGESEMLAAAEAPVRRLRYDQALRRARWAFRDGDVSTARRFAREAFSHRRTIRAGAVLGSLTLPRRLLGRIYPLKQKLAVAGRRLRQRWSP